MAAASETVLQALVFDYLSRKDKTFAEVYQKKFKSVSGVLAGEGGVWAEFWVFLGEIRVFGAGEKNTRVFFTTHFFLEVDFLAQVLILTKLFDNNY